MDPAAEVARIKADFAARHAAWLAAIRARLAQGPATSRQLAEECGCRPRDWAFSAFLTELKRAGRLVVVGTTKGPAGSPCSLFKWQVMSEANGRTRPPEQDAETLRRPYSGWYMRVHRSTADGR